MVGSSGRPKGGSSPTAVDQPSNNPNHGDASKTEAIATTVTATAHSMASDRQRRDEFLRAAMRIFLVVSPPVGRIQNRSRSLTHMDTLEGETSFQDPIEIPKITESPRLIVSPPLQARRQKLARSQVSSSEYFSVTFDIGNPNDPDEFVVASKGISLAEALSGVCARRGINISDINVYLDAYKTPLPVLTTDTAWLGGKHVLVKGKESLSSRNSLKSTNSCPFRRKSGSYRSRGSRFFSVSSDESANTNDGDKSSVHKSAKQRWSVLFGNAKDTRMEQLVEQLNSYSKHGIPQIQSVDEDFEEALYNLEDTWKDIVRESVELTEKQLQQQTAIWELVETEVTYIHTLRVLTDLFLSCLCSLQSNNILTEIDNRKLFSNILEIYFANRYFWCQHLLPMLAFSRETGKPMNPLLLSEGFLKFSEIFYPYTKYCMEQQQCQKYCREKHQENELFTGYLVWCETQKDCNRLRLMDILVKPMQRITKYSLLLKAILKHTENEQHKRALEEMIGQVDAFVNNVNTALRYKQELEKILVVVSKIEMYDVVESKDEDLDRILKSYNDFDLTCPMPGCCNSQRRFLLLEGDLKLKENTGSKVDVHCFLFTDMLLICKASNKKSDCKFRVLKQPFIIERLVVHELPRDPPILAVVYLTEYRVPGTAFLLTSSDNKLLKLWASNIKKAQELYSTAKQATAGVHPSVLALSRQPSSLFDDEWVDTEHDGESHSVASLGLFPFKSPRGSSKGSSLNHSHSGSVEMNEGMSSMSQSRGISVENELIGLRGSSQSSDEGASSLITDRSHYKRHILSNNRRKCPSPNTLSIQVPVFSNLGQSLPNLNQMSCTNSNPPSNMLLAPPKGTPSRGISYPPPSPPLRRSPALAFSRNPPLLKTRHISGSTTSNIVSCDVECGNQEGSSNNNSQQTRYTLLKKLTRTENKRYHTAGAVDDIKKQDFRDTRIYKRLSWNCGRLSSRNVQQVGTALSSSGITVRGKSNIVTTASNGEVGMRNSSSSSCSCDSTSTGLTDSRSLTESIQETYASKDEEISTPVDNSVPSSSSTAVYTILENSVISSNTTEVNDDINDINRSRTMKFNTKNDENNIQPTPTESDTTSIGNTEDEISVRKRPVDPGGNNKK